MPTVYQGKRPGRTRTQGDQTASAGSITIATLDGTTKTVVVNGDTGTFTLSYDGDATAALDEEDAAAAIATALEATDSITDVTVTGAGTQKNPFVVTFVDPNTGVTALSAVFSGFTNTVVAADRA